MSEVKVPNLRGLSQAEAEIAITAFSATFPGSPEDMLATASEVNGTTMALLTAISERLHRRNQDVQDLLSCVKTAAELTKKIERMCRRMSAEAPDANV